MFSRSSRSLLGAAFVASIAVIGLVAASAQATTLPTLTLTLTKSSIAVGGTQESGGVNIVTTATGVKEATAILIRLRPGVSVAELEGAFGAGAGKDPNKIGKYGSIVFSAEVTPSAGNDAQTFLEPGQYVAVSPGKGPGPKPHMAFTVATATSPVALPTPEATIRTIEFGFTGPRTLHDGELVRFENEGFLVHMDIAFPAKSKSAAMKIVKGLVTGKEKGLEKLVTGEPISFVPPLSHEAFEQETITAKPGWYVQACFMETQDGRDHTRLGMERIIKITK
jgi:hypothetical protein